MNPTLNPVLTKAAGQPVLMVEALSVSAGDVVRFRFKAAAPTFRQGIWIALDGEAEVNGVRSSQFEVWKDTAPDEIAVKVISADPECLWFYNIWERPARGGFPATKMSQTDFAGMLKEELATGTTYRCNDMGPVPTFQSLVFSVMKSTPK